MQRRTVSKPQTFLRRLSGLGSSIKERASVIERWAIQKIDKAPLASFFTLLFAALVLIIIGNVIRTPKVEQSANVHTPKEVSVFTIGTSPKVSVSGKVDKSGVITIIAQTAGVVSGIWVTEGQSVDRGGSLVSLSTNYQGGVLPSVQRQLAQANFEYVVSNYDIQKDMIQKRRDIANTADTQADDMRDIASKSLDDTRNLISLDENIAASLDIQLAYLESINVGGASDSAILQVKQAKAGILTALTSLKNGLRTAEYQSSPDKAPAHIADKSRELTNVQLDLETKALDLNREISELNLRMAQIGESLMYPASPIAGIVERVSVHVGDVVSPGMTLMTIKGNATTTNIIALVSSDLARRVSRFEQATISLRDTDIRLIPRYISSEPTDGSLHSVVFTLPAGYEESVANKSYVPVQLPVSGPRSLTSIPFIPIDAVYQTQTDAYIFIATQSAQSAYIAQSKKVTLGQLIGSYVEVKDGVNASDKVIIDRVVSSGDTVSIR